MTAPCTVAVNLDSTSVCDSMVGSITVFLDKNVPEVVAQQVRQDVIFTIRTGMAAGRYETPNVLKAIFIEDTSADQLQSNTSASMAVWTPESGMSASTIVAVVFCILIIIATVVMQLLFFKRSKKPAPTPKDNNEESLASSVSHVEDVWQKALDTYDHTRTGIDPIGGYVVTQTQRTDSSDNFSDNGNEVELANDVEHDEHLVAFDKAANGIDPPHSDEEGSDVEKSYNDDKVDSHDPPDDDQDEVSDMDDKE